MSFIERPFHPTTLVSLSHSALRGRRRQYEARARLSELNESRERVIKANHDLERRVEERTRELQAAYQKALQESAQREAAEEQLRQSQKLEMIGQLTGGVAHDFNNLLTAVMGNLSLLQKSLSPDDARARRLIDGATQGATRAAALTQRLLAFARQQSLQVVPTDVVELVAGMKDLLHRSIGATINLSFELTQRPAIALIDANQVELALLNLAVNARDAMVNGGDLRIGVDHSHAAQDELDEQEFVRIWVEDTGTGMDEQTLQRAIDPFFSTKELGKGTGLGLSMVHGLAVQLQGTLRLQSVVGQGTRAELYFPATTQVAEKRTDGEMKVVAPARRSRILLVDDDPLTATSSVDMLVDLGHHVQEANSGEQALSILRSNTFDLLITDFAMPGMTGLQLIEAVHALLPDLPVLLATGYAEFPADQGKRFPILGKPYTQSTLAAALLKLLGPA